MLSTVRGPSSLSTPLLAALEAQRGFSARSGGLWDDYPGAINPSAARLLLRLVEGRVLDPFCGSGTILMEASRLGMLSTGCDASPPALFISAHRTWRPSDAELADFQHAASAAVAELRARSPRAPAGGRRGDWLCPQCGAHVFASKCECFACGASKPPRITTPWAEMREVVASYAVRSGASRSDGSHLSPLW